MKNYKTSIVHFENGVQIFENSEDFISFVKSLFIENEIDNVEPEDRILKPISTYEDCLFYLMFYCSNFKLQFTNYLHKD